CPTGKLAPEDERHALVAVPWQCAGGLLHRLAGAATDPATAVDELGVAACFAPWGAAGALPAYLRARQPALCGGRGSGALATPGWHPDQPGPVPPACREHRADSPDYRLCPAACARTAG